jgi:hypothetical protein
VRFGQTTRPGLAGFLDVKSPCHRHVNNTRS